MYLIYFNNLAFYNLHSASVNTRTPFTRAIKTDDKNPEIKGKILIIN